MLKTSFIADIFIYKKEKCVHEHMMGEVEYGSYNKGYC